MDFIWFTLGQILFRFSKRSKEQQVYLISFKIVSVHIYIAQQRRLFSLFFSFFFCRFAQSDLSFDVSERKKKYISFWAQQLQCSATYGLISFECILQCISNNEFRMSVCASLLKYPKWKLIIPSWTMDIFFSIKIGNDKEGMRMKRERESKTIEKAVPKCCWIWSPECAALAAEPCP